MSKRTGSASQTASGDFVPDSGRLPAGRTFPDPARAGDPRMTGDGDLFDRYPYDKPGKDRIYERTVSGEIIPWEQSNWVLPTDYEQYETVKTNNPNMMIRLLIFLASLFLFGACASPASAPASRAEGHRGRNPQPLPRGRSSSPATAATGATIPKTPWRPSSR